MARVTVVWRRELGMLLNWTDILDGAIANAAWGVVSMVAKPRASRRTAAVLDSVAWADTGQLIRDALAGIKAKGKVPGLQEEEVAELTAALERHEVQGALQALLAVRLTDAPEADAAQARQAVRLALSDASPHYDLRMLARGAFGPEARPAARAKSRHSADTALDSFAGWLSEYFDEKISMLVATLEGRVGFEGLAQVRAEAYNSRLVALLGAIERQVTALTDVGRRGALESHFLERYRRQARERHGKIEPPDFERRRRVPVKKIYVETSLYAYGDSRVEFGWHPAGRSDLNVMHLADRIDRTVLLGDPGGGKSTAANILANHFASDTARKIPFLVTLRDYAASEPIQLSVAGYIEQSLSTLYQCEAPEGLVERLLVTGRALVIFDGLDELLETARRQDISERVELFCSSYPLTPVLVTSRVTGYAQAELDPEQFSCYRLGGFGDSEVDEYARKWFALQDGFTAAEAESEARSFLAESAGIPDLRYNPLLLALMCILYRGEGSLPRDRAGIYGRCAEMLLGKWDERRRIHHELQAGYLVEPAIRHLAWWIFNNQDSRNAVSERALVNEAASFLHGRGFESEEMARAAAKEFVEFCRGRMWVFSDAGTTAEGESLYAFTHRTFLEYFAAGHLATVSDIPEDLAGALAPHVVSVGGWNLVGELAIQIKDRNSDRGADRIYAVLLDPSLATAERGPLLAFLVGCLKSVPLSPDTLRRLTQATVRYRLAKDSPLPSQHPLRTLLSHGDRYRELVADEVSNQVAAMVASQDAALRVDGLQLALEIGEREIGERKLGAFWSEWSWDQAVRYATKITTASALHKRLRRSALISNAISIEQALAMPEGLGALMEVYPQLLSMHSPDAYPVMLVESLSEKVGSFSEIAKELAIIGSFVARDTNPHFFISRDTARVERSLTLGPLGPGLEDLPFNELAGLGCATICAIYAELQFPATSAEFKEIRKLGVLAGARAGGSLDRIPMPPQFRRLFQDWGEGTRSFVTITGD